MAHGKLYRNFIILQEDERGHSKAQDKPLSGYAKVEAKEDKCKVSFYAQNLNKDEHKCYMVIVCAKRDMRQLVNLGEVNITDIGKVDGFKEFSANNIGGLGLGYDKISGAAIVKKVDDKLQFLISGFMSNEMPKDNWKEYTLMNSMDMGKFMGGSTSGKSAPSETEAEAEKSNTMGKATPMMEGTPIVSNTPMSQGTEMPPSTSMSQNMPMTPMVERSPEESPEESELPSEGEVIFEPEVINRETEKSEVVEPSDNTPEEIQWEEVSNDEPIESVVSSIGRNIGGAKPPTIEADTIEVRSEFDEYESNIDEEQEAEFRPQGSVGEFFESIAEDFELDRHKNKKKDIKYCKWYKVKVDNLDDMCNVTDYNKYTVIYYPMINYYPYFKKHGHFCVGYKCNDKSKMKYIVYGVPGKKDKGDQPYGGKTGFVTWMEDESLGTGMGYWLMFYDFRNSVIVIPSER